MDLVEGDLPLRLVHDVIGDHGSPTACTVFAPCLGQEQTQCDGKRHLVASQRDRDERLAVGLLAKLTAVLMRDADRVLSLLGDRGVIDDEVRASATEERVRLLEEYLLDRFRVPA